MNLLGLLAIVESGSAGWIAGLIVAAIVLLREVFIRVFSNTRRR